MTPKTYATILKKLLIQLGDKPLNNLNIDDLTARSTLFIINELVNLHGEDLETINDDEFYVCTIFTFIIANHISHKLNVKFEENIIMAYNAMFVNRYDSVNLYNTFKNTTKSYNSFCQSHAEVHQQIGNAFADYIVEPRGKQMGKLLKMFRALINVPCECDVKTC